jgi:hypothetical protein
VQAFWLALRQHRRSPSDASLGVPARRGYTARRPDSGLPIRAGHGILVRFTLAAVTPRAAVIHAT